MFIKCALHGNIPTNTTPRGSAGPGGGIWRDGSKTKALRSSRSHCNAASLATTRIKTKHFSNKLLRNEQDTFNIELSACTYTAWGSGRAFCSVGLAPCCESSTASPPAHVQRSTGKILCSPKLYHAFLTSSSFDVTSPPRGMEQIIKFLALDPKDCFVIFNAQP